jgi:hypothetical protein
VLGPIGHGGTLHQVAVLGVAHTYIPDMYAGLTCTNPTTLAKLELISQPSELAYNGLGSASVFTLQWPNGCAALPFRACHGEAMSHSKHALRWPASILDNRTCTGTHYRQLVNAWPFAQACSLSLARPWHPELDTRCPATRIGAAVQQPYATAAGAGSLMLCSERLSP